MIDLAEVTRKVEAEQEKKSDVVMNLQSAIPLAGVNGVELKMGAKTCKPFTKTGLSSFLGRINIPDRFFNKCPSSLQAQILEYHFPKNNKQEVIIRLYEDSIRFVGSSKYSKFDDIDVLDALGKSGGLKDLKIQHFSHTPETLMLRFTTPEPILGLKRPFFPGVQISNSEVGKSAIKIQFILYEEVCTNGMIISVDTFESYSRKHIGKISEFKGKLAKATDEMLAKIPAFMETSAAMLQKTAKVSAEEMVDRIKKDTRIPKKIKETLNAYLPKYLGEDQSGTGLEVISALTESLQSYNWDARNHYERIAGEYVWQ